MKQGKNPLKCTIQVLSKLGFETDGDEDAASIQKHFLHDSLGMV